MTRMPPFFGNTVLGNKAELAVFPTLFVLRIRPSVMVNDDALLAKLISARCLDRT